ncbi:DUF1453 domain-containing protein [Streptomyces sp. NPDC054841]
MNGWVIAAVVVVLLIAIVIKRLIGEPLNARDLWGAPIILTAIGVWTVAKTDGLTGTDIGWATGSCVLGFAVGAVRGSAVTVFEKGGVLWQRYTGKTFLYVVGALVIMAGFSVLAQKMGMHAEARPIHLAIGISFLGESAAVSLRALKTGVPFAPEQQRAGLRR